MSLFQSNLRKQIGNLPKILNFVKIIHYYSKSFTGVLNFNTFSSEADLFHPRPPPLRVFGFSGRVWRARAGAPVCQKLMRCQGSAAANFSRVYRVTSLHHGSWTTVNGFNGFPREREPFGFLVFTTGGERQSTDSTDSMDSMDSLCLSSGASGYKSCCIIMALVHTHCITFIFEFS